MKGETLSMKCNPSAMKYLNSFRFGESTVRNGVHCTDLPEDASLEINYFFSVLQ